MHSKHDEIGLKSWLVEASSPDGFTPLNDSEHGPVAMFAPLALPPAALCYIDNLSGHDLVRFESQHSHTIHGWHFDPAASVTARSKLSIYLDRMLPRGTGKADLIDRLALVYSQLASGLDTSVLCIEPRSRLAPGFEYDESLHIDAITGLEKTAIAYLRGPRTVFAQTSDIPAGTKGWGGVFLTPEMRPKLAAPPPLSIAAWRGGDDPDDPGKSKPAWHAEPYIMPGKDRFIIVSRIYSAEQIPGNRRPALR